MAVRGVSHSDLRGLGVPATAPVYSACLNLTHQGFPEKVPFLPGRGMVSRVTGGLKQQELWVQREWVSWDEQNKGEQ